MAAMRLSCFFLLSHTGADLERSHLLVLGTWSMELHVYAVGEGNALTQCVKEALSVEVIPRRWVRGHEPPSPAFLFYLVCHLIKRASRPTSPRHSHQIKQSFLFTACYSQALRVCLTYCWAWEMGSCTTGTWTQPQVCCQQLHFALSHQTIGCSQWAFLLITSQVPSASAKSWC